MARKNNRKNRRRIAFYGINKFDYKAREKLAVGQSPLKETPKEEGIVIEASPENEWTKIWTPKITIVQTTSRKA